MNYIVNKFRIVERKDIKPLLKVQSKFHYFKMHCAGKAHGKGMSLEWEKDSFKN